MTTRAVLVTGAGKGLGAAFAEGLARDGCAVMVNNRSHPGQKSSAERTAQFLREKKYHAFANNHAVDGEGAALAIVDAVIERFGMLDILVLNAGITGPAAKVGQLEDKDIRKVMEINFHANTALVDVALPYILKSPAGRILFIASTAGLYGVRGRASYAASKGALIAYARTLADELARTQVRVNILAPVAATAMTTQNGEKYSENLLPAHATAAAVWLCRPECDRTGEIWACGADYFARAAAVEGHGGGHPDANADWFGKNVAHLASLDNPHEYPGAEAAFASFYKRATKIREKEN